MLRAWRALPTFEDRTGLRPWLYRIATNVCIDMLSGRSRRALPMDVAPVATGELRRGDPRPEATWIQPAPDSLILPPGGDPAERAVSRESVRLAFIAALQHLAPRQRAVLILRDVLRWRAAEVAVLLDTSADAVNSSLRRARAALAAIDRDSTPSQPSEGDRELLAAYIDAFEGHDVDAVVGLLRDDAILEMPRSNFGCKGRRTYAAGFSPLTPSDRSSSHRSMRTARRPPPSTGRRRREAGRQHSPSRCSTSLPGAPAPSMSSWTQLFSNCSASRSNQVPSSPAALLCGAPRRTEPTLGTVRRAGRGDDRVVVVDRYRRSGHPAVAEVPDVEHQWPP
jgi:RNA polymerase sigma-70 factor, ECF subfamily